ncbi:MAG: hypothetical protein ABIW19_11540 [Vicinamibacterales bacterium]
MTGRVSRAAGILLLGVAMAAQEPAPQVSDRAVSDLTLSFTDRPSEFEWTHPGRGWTSAPEYFIILFAAEKGFWTPQSRRVQSKRPASDGRFSFPNMVAGNYYLAAVTDVEPREWYDPALLAQLAPGSIKLMIGDGDKKVQDIQVTGRERGILRSLGAIPPGGRTGVRRRPRGRRDQRDDIARGPS